MADAKLSALATQSAPVLADVAYTVDQTFTSLQVPWNRSLGLLTFPVSGRLTTETAVPVSSSDRTAQGTIFYTPYVGQLVALYDGTRWKMYSTPEISLGLTATSGKNYDVFLFDSSGTVTLELSAAWTDDVTRADALALQNGVTVKSGAATRRWIGTIRASGANVTEDSKKNRLVWNAYNQVLRPSLVVDTNSHTYNSATFHSWNNDATVQTSGIFGAPTSMMLFVAPDFSPAAISGFPGVVAALDWTSGGGAAGDPYIYLSVTASDGFARQILGSPSPATVVAGYHYWRVVEADLDAVVTTFQSVSSGGIWAM